MMEKWANDFPQLCHIDTIGTSVKGRLILSLFIETPSTNNLYRPEFFYSSTIHGDEVTGFVMLLRLIDTLLNGYGNNPQYTNLLNRTRISINPLANPDGTYYLGDNTVQGSVRYNAHHVDLNRNYPNPFVSSKATIEPENEAMINYFDHHLFRLSANLHGGSEVMNYPWDSFTSLQNPHPCADWWIDVCKRFVDTCRTYNNSHFRDVTSSGYIAGGDWYVISGGRQDYMNAVHGCRELTMEISSQKTLSSTRLPEYWQFLQHSLVNYIFEIHTLPGANGIADVEESSPSLEVFPNPAVSRVILRGCEAGQTVVMCDITGRELSRFVAGAAPVALDVSGLPVGIYLLHCGGSVAKFVKQK
jgi:hypothetical protein